MVASEHLYQTTVQFDKTIVLPRKLLTGSIHDYLFCYCPLVGILFEVLRITDYIIRHTFKLLVALSEIFAIPVFSHHVEGSIVAASSRPTAEYWTCQTY